MAIDYQERICDLLGQPDDSQLTADQMAAKKALAALAELMALAETIEFGGVKLSSLFGRFGIWQIVNDDGLWAKAKVTDWIAFENRLAAAGAALYLTAQARGLKLDRLARARAVIDAERQEDVR